MVSAILHAAMGMMGLFAFLVFLAISVVALVPVLGSIYYLIADLYKEVQLVSLCESSFHLVLTLITSEK